MKSGKRSLDLLKWVSSCFLVILIEGCEVDLKQDCQSKCNREYEKCLKGATTEEERIECGQAKQFCTGDCLTGGQDDAFSITGPGERCAQPSGQQKSGKID